MAGIDESLTFYPLRIAVLTVSDTRDEQTDKSGGLLAERLTAAGHELAGKAIVTDDVDAHWARYGRQFSRPPRLPAVPNEELPRVIPPRQVVRIPRHAEKLRHR